MFVNWIDNEDEGIGECWVGGGGWYMSIVATFLRLFCKTKISLMPGNLYVCLYVWRYVCLTVHPQQPFKPFFAESQNGQTGWHSGT